MGRLAAMHGGLERTVVIRCCGQIQAWGWRGRARALARVAAVWRDPAGDQWLRVEDAAAVVFLLGRRHDGWWAARVGRNPAAAAPAPGGLRQIAWR